MSNAEALIKAIRDRLQIGLDKETIKEEAVAAGHTDEIFEAAYVIASEKESPTLPGIELLIGEPLRYTFRNWRLVLKLSSLVVPLAVVGALFGEGLLAGELMATITVLSVGLITVFLMLVLVLGLYESVFQETTRIDFRQSFRWLRKNIWSVLWIQLLVAAVVTGGLLFFIIPGLLLAYALQFSIFTLVHEKSTGEEALLRSRTLVSGYWWAVFSRLFAIGLIASLLSGPGSDIIFRSAELIVEPFGFALAIVLEAILHVALTLFSVRAAYQIYQALLEVERNSKAPSLQLQRILAVLGGVFLAIVFGVLVYMSGYAITNPDTTRTFIEEAVTEMEIQTNSPTTFDDDQYSTVYEAFPESYQGICNDILATLNTDTFECNDSVEAWAFSIDSGEATSCYDSTGYRKRLIIPLDDRTKCLPL